MGYRCHESAFVDPSASIGDNTSIWHFSVVHAGARIGSNCSLGQNVCVSGGAVIGNGVRIQNNVSVFLGVELEDDVFCGPSMVFTNVLLPRSEFPCDRRDYGRTLVRRGASLGAGCVIVAGNTVGAYAMVGAGAVVTRDVLSHALMTGVPARWAGWVCRCGSILSEDLARPRCGRRYAVDEAGLCEQAGPRGEVAGG